MLTKRCFFLLLASVAGWCISTDGVVRIGLGGDVMLGRLVNEKLNRVAPTYIWGDLLPTLRSNDVNIVNLETALTRSTQRVPKVFNFKADPKHVQALIAGNIHVVNNANNHVLDFGIEGLKETIETLDRAGILHVGAGLNAQEAARPAIIEKNGLKIGVLGYTDNEPSWKAGANKPGTNYISIEHDRQRVQEDIKKLKPEVDLIIITLHWGPNWQERPPQAFRDLTHAMIDAGADVIHGHSNHVFQGIEWYKDKLILYQTGDFVDDYAIDPSQRNDRSFLFIIEVYDKSLEKLSLVPTIIDNMQVNAANARDARESLGRMQRLSAELIPPPQRIER